MSRRPIGRVVWALVALAGLLLLGGGVAVAASPPEPTLTATTPGLDGVPVLVTAPGVLGMGGPSVRVEVTSRDARGPVFVGVGRAGDVEAYLAGVARTDLTGWADGRTAVTSRAGAPSVVDPAGVDVWVVSASGTGSVSLQWPDLSGSWVAVAATDGGGPPRQVALTWTRGATTSPAPALVAIGLVLVVAGSIGTLVLRRGRRVPPEVPPGPGRPGAAAIGVLLVPLLAVLGGCAQPALVPRAEPDPPHPALAPRQAERVLDAVDAAVTRVRSAPRGADLPADPRLVGPVREALAAQATVRRGSGGPAPGADPPGRTRLVLPESTGWPRWFLVAGQAPDRPTPVVRVLRSGTAREPYGLWAELALLPGASLPEPGRTAGAQVLAPDAGSGLVAAPTQVLRRYAGRLTSGRTPAGVAPDAYADELLGRLRSDRERLGAKGVATVSAVHVPAKGPVLALRTSDGGALVVGAVEQTYVVTVGKGKGSVTVTDPALASLFGRPTITRELRRTSLEVFAFAVPAAGSGAPVRLLAASRTDLRATGS